MKKTYYIPVEKVRPGQAFQHRGLRYRRATDEEATKHPSRDLESSRRVGPLPVWLVGTPGTLVFGYNLVEKRKQAYRIPCAFLESVHVIVRGKSW